MMFEWRFGQLAAISVGVGVFYLLTLFATYILYDNERQDQFKAVHIEKVNEDIEYLVEGYDLSENQITSIQNTLFRAIKDKKEETEE